MSEEKHYLWSKDKYGKYKKVARINMKEDLIIEWWRTNVNEHQ